MTGYFLDPIILCFIAGIVLKIVKPSLRIPKQLYEFISAYLLITIGLKGGLALQQWASTQLVVQSFAVMFLSVICTFLALGILRAFKFYSKQDALVIAAHYGSVSIGTFAVALSILKTKGISYEAYMPLFVALMEFPAIIVANILMNGESSKHKISTFLYNTFAHKSLYYLVGSIMVGVLFGNQLYGVLKPVFFDTMHFMLGIFLVEMGMLVGRQIATIKKQAGKIITASLTVTLACATLGFIFGIFLKLSPGGVILLTTLASNASYIAVPASLRKSYPKSNVGLALSHSLGVTFPFNVLIGIYLYTWIVNYYFA